MSDSTRTLVEDFNALELGWTVELRACKQCGADHVLYLDAYMPRAQGHDLITDTLTDHEPVFIGIAASEIIGTDIALHSGRVGIFRTAVDEKRVFRVVDAPDNTPVAPGGLT